jgi:hypothetical protein
MNYISKLRATYFFSSLIMKSYLIFTIKLLGKKDFLDEKGKSIVLKWPHKAFQDATGQEKLVSRG